MSSMSIKPVVTYDVARRAVDAAIAEAERLGVSVAVSVVDPGGHDIAFAAMDGSPLLSREVARDKAWTAIAFGQPTTWWAEMITDDPNLAALGSNNRLVPVPGGVPLLVTHDGDQGEGIAGAVGVSGAATEQDEHIAAAAVAAIRD
jgi:uncharacterized protein GlcG (DUF336 family)